MQIPRRQLDIVIYVARFGLLRSSQIRSLCFSGLRSETSASRDLTRLVELNYLRRVELARIGGGGGGSGQYIFELGPEGKRLMDNATTRRKDLASLEHTLAIADLYIMLLNLERAGVIQIREYLTEPECHVRMMRATSKVYLRPDLTVEFLWRGQIVRLMFEIDRRTQWARRITEKLVNYWKAYDGGRLLQQDDTLGDGWPSNQAVRFIAQDEHRAGELRRTIAKGRPEQQDLFKVHTLESLEKSLRGE